MRDLSNPPTVNELARHLQVPRRTLHARFQKCLGVGPQEVLLRERMRNAERLLLEEEVPVARVAELCGFKSNTHFATQFKKRMGITPSQFRLTHSAGYADPRSR